MFERCEKTSADNGAAHMWGPGSREWWYPRFLATGVLALSAFGLWSYQHRNDTLRTQRLEIVDARGKTCAVLGAMPGGQSGLTLIGATGEPRATLSISENGNPSLMLRNSDGMQRASLEISPKGQSVLLLLNDNGEVRAAVQVDKEGKSVVKVTGMNGKSEAALSYDGGHNSDVRINNGPFHSDARNSHPQAAGGKRKPHIRVSLFSHDAHTMDGRLLHASLPFAN